MERRISVLCQGLILVGSILAPIHAADAASGVIEKGQFRFHYSDKGVSGLANTTDPFGASVTPAERPLGMKARFKTAAGEWTDLDLGPASLTVLPAGSGVTYTLSRSESPLKITQTFKTDGTVMDWIIELDNAGASTVTIGDLAVEMPSVGPWGEDPRQIFERGFLKHPFISGSGSFIYFVRASGAPPFLMVTVHPGTKLEYSSGGWRGSLHYIHSGLNGGDEKRGTWRQEHTFLVLGGMGASDSHARYGFRFQWANSYDELREVLYREGLFDIRVVPGMSVPEDLTVRLALRTRAHVDSLQAEFPDQTKIVDLGEKLPGVHVYEAAFKRLGENMLTIHHDGGQKTLLEFFVTEPLEILIKKRSSFIVNRQQIHDPAKWWDGVFAPYDMKNRVLRTPEDVDIFKGRMAYVLTCDDPGLCKAPFVAEKNASFPDQKEIDGLEYYLQHFVWGKLQRTDQETPYPYGIYGTPDWYTNRDPERRARYTQENLDKMHVWRSYDYPHIVMLYYHMYEIAKKYPEMPKYLGAAGYLQRAYQTARALFIYPYEIFPSYYETYKWGLYNETVVLKLADALDAEGFPAEAAWLRAEWEKKVKYFVYDDAYPFRSEYAFDRTAFESSYALAKYGATHDMKPDQNLWWDVKLKKWYSHPLVRREDSRAFMDRQLSAGLCVRGWLEASYYQLGADGGLSYMAAMGGWGILDYALSFASAPHDWLQLGYASYLSSWCLMNTGRPDTNWGFWFPGPENDGAAGWQFMSAKWGHAWMGADVPRGPWNYDGEIDLGFGGALRMAATIVTRDPIFDWIAYGGQLTVKGDTLSVVPRDGLRQRLAVLLPDDRSPSTSGQRLKIELDRDGLAASESAVMDVELKRLTFKLENRTRDKHTTRLRVSFPVGSQYEVFQDGRKAPLTQTGGWDYPWSADLQMKGQAPVRIEMIRTDAR